MNTIRLCPGCGAPLTSDAPAGLCPQCLLKTQVIGEEELAALPSARAVPVPGEQFGDYHILKLLGHGGMGEVFEAEHVTSGRRVALKVMRHTLASEQDRKRFLREGRLAASVNHPNVVYIHGSEEIFGAPAIAMELVHGGTLKDRLKREGPLPISEAVEGALQIIDGLEAAHSAGVLHRDIKPANCFIAADGTVKVGDFGLSVSTLARGESLITATGSVMGTPAYASPEQLRGEELDVRSDIYSVGATLYHLLTGKTPFTATDFVKLITEVLDKAPAPPKSLREEIPIELAKVILRCLAKERKARFQSYAELRDALLPFRSSEAVPAKPAMRFLAGAVDDLVAYGPWLLFIAYWSFDPLDKFSRERTLHAALVWLSFYAFYLVYYAIAEGLWGAGIGKMLCGLRVVRRDGQRAGIRRAALRVLIYSYPWTWPTLVAILMTAPDITRSAAERGGALMDWIWLPLTLALFVTIRARNGYAAIHDLASGTRVIVRPKTQPRPALAVVKSETNVSSAPAAKEFSPYAVNGSLWKTSSEELLLAFDSALRRKVWIHWREPGVAPVSGVRRDLSRAARLRWINGGTLDCRPWDAYEALDGAPFLDVAQRVQSWNAVRFWLLDLADECATAIQLSGPAPVLSLDRVWITNAGRAVLLDFPAPGLVETTQAIHFGELRDVESLQQFLDSIAHLALEGQGDAAKNIRALVPLHAKSFLASLANRTFDEARFIVGNLQSLIGRPAEMARTRRAASLLFVPAVTLIFAALIVAMIVFDRIRWDRAWAAAYPDRLSVREVASLYEDRASDVERGEAKPEELELVGSYVVAHYSDIITNENFWAMPSRITSAADVRRPLRQALKKFPNPNAQAVAQAEGEVPSWIAKREGHYRATLLFLGMGMVVLVTAVASLVEFIGALGFGTSPVLRLFGIAVVNRAGEIASRGRLLWRWALIWLPVGGVILVVAGLLADLAVGHQNLAAGQSGLAVGHGGDGEWIAGGVAAVSALFIGGALAIYAVLRPQAGLQDRLAGTRLVPV